MSDLIAQLQAAQRDAGERAVIADLQRKGLAPAGAKPRADVREFTAKVMAESLFQHIAHGDEKHRAWLQQEALAWARKWNEVDA